MKLAFRPLDLRLKTPFTIARGTLRVARNVLIELRRGDLVGYGEAAPTTSGYYGETQESILAILAHLAPALADGPDHLVGHLPSFSAFADRLVAR
ncbi:MAG: hypothetical protein HY331_04605 [Chloroflexi bacterium]|nr:hypothetical protein [Chloroflexota bacterium]